MVEKWVLQVGAVLWAMGGFAVAAISIVGVDGGVPLLVLVATVLFPLCSLLAGLAIAHDRPRWAGALLLLSVATPTYFAWVLNVPALVVGAALLVAPGRTVRGPSPRLSQL